MRNIQHRIASSIAISGSYGIFETLVLSSGLAAVAYSFSYRYARLLRSSFQLPGSTYLIGGLVDAKVDLVEAVRDVIVGGRHPGVEEAKPARH